MTNTSFHELDRKLGSFVAVAQDTQDKKADNNTGALAGLTVGVKDIIDVAGFPTCNGSRARAGSTSQAKSDATVVAALRAAGASIVGKTTTTEFAFTDPTDCRNPYDLNRSPGGSSSGSGAAVSAGLVDLALGTQTAGSLCRPAAYCGVVGLKPTFGVLPTDGVTPLARSFDTVGLMARSVATVRSAFVAMAPASTTGELGKSQFTRLLFSTEVHPTRAFQAAYEDASKLLSTENGSLSDAVLDLDIGGIVAAHRTVMLAEAAVEHGLLLKAATVEKLRPNFRKALEIGLSLTWDQVAEARDHLATAKTSFWHQLDGIDVILTLPVPEGAPLLDGTTGFQDWLTPWTVFGGPLICLPWGLDRMGRPRSVMLAGRPGRDMHLLEVAQKLEDRAPPMPRPEHAVI